MAVELDVLAGGSREATVESLTVPTNRVSGMSSRTGLYGTVPPCGSVCIGVWNEVTQGPLTGSCEYGDELWV
jgi:hypothetical protein